MNDFDTRPLCLSGGAEGADLQWGMTAGMLGHSVIHWSFAGHKTNAPKEEVVILPQNLLNEADPYCLQASKTIKRYFPPKSTYVANLLRRNWYQVNNAQSVYAVSSTDENGLVGGGTAWATQMFIDKHNGNACPCYVFSQSGPFEGYWLEWDGSAGWKKIYQPPLPTNVWAGIGTRELTVIGKLAIRILMNYKKPMDKS